MFPGFKLVFRERTPQRHPISNWFSRAPSKASVANQRSIDRFSSAHTSKETADEVKIVKSKNQIEVISEINRMVMSLDRSKVNFILFRKYGIHIQPFEIERKFLDYFDFWFENNFWSKMDFPYTELTPKGQVKVNEGHMEALFDDVRDEDFPEDNVINSFKCSN